MIITNGFIKGIYQGTQEIKQLSKDTDMFSVYNSSLKKLEDYPYVVLPWFEDNVINDVTGKTGYYAYKSKNIQGKSLISPNVGGGGGGINTSYYNTNFVYGINTPGQRRVGLKGMKVNVPTNDPNLNDIIGERYQECVVSIEYNNAMCSRGFIMGDYLIAVPTYGLLIKQEDRINISDLDFDIKDYNGVSLTPEKIEIDRLITFITTKEPLDQYFRPTISQTLYGKEFNSKEYFITLDLNKNFKTCYGYVPIRYQDMNVTNIKNKDFLGTVNAIDDYDFSGGIAIDPTTKQIEGMIVGYGYTMDCFVVHWFNLKNTGINKRFKDLLNTNNFNRVFPIDENDKTKLDYTIGKYTLSEGFYKRLPSNPIGTPYESSVYIENRKYENSSTIGTGSGVVVDKHTVLTNRHVVWDSEERYVVTPDKVTVKLGLSEGVYKKAVKVIDIIETPADIVVLKTEEDLSKFVKPLEIAKESEIKARPVGSYVLKFGYPGTEYTDHQPPNMYLSRGFNLNITKVDKPNGADISFSKNETYPGMSGSPVVDNRFKLLGLHNANFSNSGNPNDKNMATEHLITGETRKIIMQNLD